jgi:two-component system sensor histidine kinase QseC
VKSIRERLTITLAALCCLLWCAGGIAVYVAVRSSMISEFDLRLKQDVLSLTNMTEQSEKELKFDSTGDLLPGFDRPEGADYFQLWEPSGSTLMRSPALDQDHDLPRRAGTMDAPVLWNVILPDGLSGRAIGIRFVPKPDEDEPRTPGGPPLNKEVTLVGAFHRGDLDRALNNLAAVLLSLGGIMAVATIAVVSVVIKRGLRLLADFGERAGLIDATSLQLRFQTNEMPAELLPIAERLNDLLARLEASFIRERRFSSDVAHELRTPISELRALADVALKWPEDPAATRQALQDAQSIAQQMEAIATGLMALEGCEASRFVAEPVPIAIRPLMEEILLSLEPKMRAKRLTVLLKIEPDACWLTDQTALRSICTNLLANSVEYSPPASQVEVQVGTNGTGEELVIKNRNHNLVPDDLSHLFERFWRKDPARSSGLHSGLGLALARAYAQSVRMVLNAELLGTDIVFALRHAVSCAKSD